jgi:hypothetical protein
VSVVEDVFCICRLWVIVFYVTCVFFVSYSEGPDKPTGLGLAQVHRHAEVVEGSTQEKQLSLPFLIWLSVW